MTAHKNKNKNKANWMTSYRRISFSSVFGWDSSKHKRNVEKYAFLQGETATGSDQLIPVCISLGTNQICCMGIVTILLMF